MSSRLLYCYIMSVSSTKSYKDNGTSSSKHGITVVDGRVSYIVVTHNSFDLGMRTAPKQNRVCVPFVPIISMSLSDVIANFSNTPCTC